MSFILFNSSKEDILTLNITAYFNIYSIGTVFTCTLKLPCNSATDREKAKSLYSNTIHSFVTWNEKNEDFTYRNYTHTILLLLNKRYLSLFSRGNPSSFRTSLSVKSIVSNWSWKYRTQLFIQEKLQQLQGMEYWLSYLTGNSYVCKETQTVLPSSPFIQIEYI